VVVDVGINRVTTGEALQEEMPRVKLVGDVNFDSVKNMVAAISPVPGGVGPMTVAALFENLFGACKR
jgi:methylenetetrahydrofolate dehydrogenase (NADP+) / methenyltetrahydrofolate cyclohydrolase